MAPIYKYVVLQAIPDKRRGERVNVGLAISNRGAVDLRISDSSKLRALTGSNTWQEYFEEYKKRVASDVREGNDPDALASALASCDEVVVPSSVSWLSARNETEYEQRIAEIMLTLVTRPPLQKMARQSRINTEIVHKLRKARLLARSSEDIRSHKVVRDFLISQEEDLRADFALKNGSLHVVATVDLRKSMISSAESALKAITLNEARKKFKRVKRIGIYAATRGNIRNVKAQIALLEEYSTEIYNWETLADQRKLLMTLHDAIPGALLNSN